MPVLADFKFTNSFSERGLPNRERNTQTTTISWSSESWPRRFLNKLENQWRYRRAPRQQHHWDLFELPARLKQSTIWCQSRPSDSQKTPFALGRSLTLTRCSVSIAAIVLTRALECDAMGRALSKDFSFLFLTTDILHPFCFLVCRKYIPGERTNRMFDALGSRTVNSNVM